MLAAIAILVGIFAAIFFHELAHFATAKAFNMKVTEFFAGFGPRLWSFRRGETEYGIKALLPLGGYVKIVGMNPAEEVAPDEEDRTYRGSAFWQKSVVVLAGVGANFLLAFVLLFAIFAIDGVIETPAEVGTVLSTLDNGEPTPASQAGLEPGDAILAVNGEEMSSWDDLLDAFRASGDQLLILTIDRDGSVFDVNLTPAIQDDRGFVGIGIPDSTERHGLIVAVSETWSLYATIFVDVVEAAGRLLWPPNLIQLFGSAASGEDPGDIRPTTPVGLVANGGNILDAGGWPGLVATIAGLNLFVGIFNLLPLYPLDGGHFAVAAYEKVRGRPVDVEKLVPVAVGVIAFFVSLFLLGLWFDIFGPDIDLG